MKTTLAIRLAPWLATAALFIVWEAACRTFNIPPFFLPPPTLVFKAVIDFWPALYKHSLFTLSSTQWQWLIAGVEWQRLSATPPAHLRV